MPTNDGFRNNAQLKGENREGLIKRYVHQPLSIDHFGIHAKIQPNGKVLISSAGTADGDEMIYDEVEIPASLVFKLATLLKATREIKYVTMAEAANLPSVAEQES